MTLDEIVDALGSPSAYPHPVGRVEVLQTHISYVLLAGDYAYKLKKPLDLGFLDYSTLERRRLMCEEEVRLNRRLCEDVYEAVVPVTCNGGACRIGGDGPPIEYAVRMRRVPRERMLDAMLAAGADGTAIVRDVARRMAEFHATADTDAGIAAFGSPQAVRANWDENFAQLDGHADRAAVAGLQAFVHGFLRTNSALLEARQQTGRVRDCHGDLRSDAVYAREDGGVCIMDCIEFNDRLRYGDVAGDIAFLMMDLAFRRRQDLADELAATYLAAAWDATLPAVTPFYACYRAVVRAKVESIRAAEPEVPADQRAAARAASQGYLRLATAYARAATHPPVLLYMVGLSGTGKSVLASAVACRIGAVVLRTDELRRETVADGPASARYAPEQRQAAYTRMRTDAAAHLADGRSVVLDATHVAGAERHAARALAREHGAQALAIECRADDALVRRRLDERAGDARAASEADWGVYLRQRDSYEPLAATDGGCVVTDAADTLASRVDAVLERLRNDG